MFDFKKKNQDPKTTPEANPARLTDRLKQTRTRLFSGLFNRHKLDDKILEDLEERLLLADVGTKTTDLIVRLLQAEAKKNPDDNPLILLKKILLPILSPVEKPLILPTTEKKPYFILVIGVNGVGKTTTIGKLAKYLQNQGKSIMLAAGDTFRAAAIEQLQVWGKRNNIKVIAQPHGSNPGAVIYDALKSARARNIDVLIADTAGRLHNKNNLIEEMKNIYRISNKFDAELQQEVMLILDAGTGQNGLIQAKQFNNAIGVDSIVLTKLDGTAKGGMVFSLAEELNTPIRFIGIGETMTDLSPFNSSEFIDALLIKEE